MVAQDVNIALLQLFDLVQATPEYMAYQQAEQQVLADYDLLIMINAYNDLSSESNQKRINELETKINDNKNYAQYLASFDDYQIMMEAVSKIIFKDIINIVKEGERCAYQQW